MRISRYRLSLFAATILFLLALLSGCADHAVRSQNNVSPTATPGKKGNKMSEELNYKTVDKGTAFKQLDSYIFEIMYGRKSEPKNLDPEHVEEFIREKIDRTRSPQSFERARNVVDVYDLRSVVDHFEKFLDKSEKEENDVLQSLQCVRLLAEQGDADTEKKAFAYYEYLVKHSASEEQYEAFVEAVTSFSSVYSPDTLQAVLKRQHARLKEKGKTDEFLDGVAEQLYTLIHGRLPQLVDQLNAKKRIRADSRPEELITKLVAIYLGQDDLSSPQIERWSARQLRKLDRDGQTATIISVFRKAAVNISSGGFEEEERDALLIRDARAVQYFRAELTDEEKELVKAGSEFQIDYLDRELY